MKPINIERLLEQIPTPETVEQQIKESRAPRRVPLPGPTSPVQIRDFDKNYLVFENIVCYDAVGKETERYPQLRVRRNVYRGEDEKIISLKPYEAIVHAEEQGDFNPSSALTTALLVAAFRGREKSYANDFLEQYRGKYSGDGWHVVNTITQWQCGTGHLIHYPQQADFPRESHVRKQINQARPRQVIDFTVDESFGNRLVSDVPAQSEFGKYLKNWCGLPDLGIVMEIGRHFSTSVKAEVPSNPSAVNYTAGAWLGCTHIYFCCSSYENYFSNHTFRGVKEI